ncbi:hypothetical protein MAR_018892 [Mya arenaria]|uniref:DED domain-containing protein n=1 Tax=Mya arenaria TaxID=6604 RepID=A0ABY7EIS8_MYAAR|nr:uncharacterized protein LOC128238782 [Mya arenaria]WAR08934.1 hypothetical protein MAR_018892 [Mya arenaria]
MSHEESIDAMPLPPHPANENESFIRRHEPVARTDPPLPLPPPPADWQFNKFLGEIADSLMMEDLVKIKHQFSGDGGIGLSVLEGINTPRELFRILKNRGYLNRNNMIYLQSALKVIGRMDLVQKAIDFCRETGNTLHFYPATEEPENGYRYVRLHVDGIDYSNCTDSYLQQLRERLASILFLPPQFIMIAGIEPSSSMLLTFMIPEQYCELLLNMLKSGEVFPCLQKLGVDVISVDELTVNLNGVTDAEKIETEQQSRLKTVYEQLAEKTKQLEKTELELLSMGRKIDKLSEDLIQANKKAFDADKIQAAFRNINREARKDVFDFEEVFTEPVRSLIQTSLDEFKDGLKKVDDHQKGTVVQILNKHTDILSFSMLEFFQLRETTLQNEIRRLKSLVIPLQCDLAKYQLLANLEKENLEESLLALLQQLFESIQGSVTDIELTDVGLAILRKISRRLRYKEKLKIERKYEWKKDDRIKKDMDTDQSFFLAGILYKEVETKQKLIDYETFISGILDEVGREDLKRKFYELLRTSHQFRRSSKIPDQPKQTPSAQAAQQDPAMSNALQKMAKQVDEMYQQMNSNLCGPRLDTDPLQTPLFDFQSKLFRARGSSTDREESNKERHVSAEQV